MKRRDFLASAAGASFVPAIAWSATDFDSTITPTDMPEHMLPREVKLRTKLEPFEIHVDPGGYALYYTQPKNMALRWSVGIGRPGLYEAGTFFVGAKKKWPGWRPTDEMIERDPESYEQFKDGMPGGPDNPLGARALYLFEPGRGDTFLRIHGTNRPETIGLRVSNGCARLVNDQIVQLYEQIPLKTKVVLHPTTITG